VRILHVIESFAPGGIETTFLTMVRHLRDQDPSVEHHVLAFAGGALESRYRQVAHSVTLGADQHTIDQRLAAGYDVAHVLFERCAARMVPDILARTTMPVVYGKGYDLSSMYRLNEGFRWQADQSLLASCDGVTFTTANLAGGYDLPPGRTTVLGKAADVARFQAIPFADEATPLRIVCVANLHPRKRLGDLVNAFAHVKASVPHAELRVVGAGTPPDVESLRTLAATTGAEHSIAVAGLVSDVAPEIRMARVVALPSSCEGVPTALLEAMASGRPVVATNVGHVSSIVDEGIEGFLIPLGDITALADRLTRLLVDPALALRMGRAARVRSTGHDVRVVARRWLDALRAVVYQPAHLSWKLRPEPVVETSPVPVGKVRPAPPNTSEFQG
jgi:glycosyltransferase involved in cell wall biosynthesis